MVLLQLLGRFLFHPPSRPLAPDLLVDLITQTGGNLIMCRVLAYGSALFVCTLSVFLVIGLRLYDVLLWREILAELVITTRPRGCIFLVPLFLVAGYYTYWSIASVQYAYTYCTHETQWYRKLRLGRYSRIWKDASFWKELQHRAMISRGEYPSVVLFDDTIDAN